MQSIYPYPDANPQLIASMKSAATFLKDPASMADLPDYLQRPIPLTADEQHFADADEEPSLRHAFLRMLHPDGYRDMRALRDREKSVASFGVADLAGVDDFARMHRDRNVYVGKQS